MSVELRTVVAAVVVGAILVAPLAIAQSAYKYFQRFRTVDGHYYDGMQRNASDTPIYVYYIRPTDLDRIDKDRERAAKLFIEDRNAVPAECRSGFRIAKIGSMENGAVAITVECT